jgi:hypothetical protein
MVGTGQTISTTQALRRTPSSMDRMEVTDE